MIEVLQTGPSLSLQAGPRNGLRRFGVGPSGPLDPESARRANNLLFNLPNDPVLEIGLGGTHLHVLQDTWLAHSGGLECESLQRETAHFVLAGTQLRFRQGSGTWSYLACPGGWVCDKVLGSFSFHSRSKIGTNVTKNSVIPAQHTEPFDPTIGKRRLGEENPSFLTAARPLKLHPGPQASLIPDHSSFLSQPFQVAPRSDRSGYRITGNKVILTPSLKSFPVLPGCIQLTPSGELIVTLNDGPTVGGYPVPFIVDPQDIPILVQHPPHSEIKLEWHEDATP